MKYKSIEPFVIGGAASCIAETFTFPIDLAKTRLQIQGQALDSLSLKYRGMIHCFSVVVKEEGASALYSGYIQDYTLLVISFSIVFLLSRIKPAWLRQATYGTLKIGIYQYLKKTSGSYPENSRTIRLFQNVKLTIKD